MAQETQACSKLAGLPRRPLHFSCPSALNQAPSSLPLQLPQKEAKVTMKPLGRMLAKIMHAAPLAVAEQLIRQVRMLC